MTIRQNYNQSVFDLLTLENEMSSLKDENKRLKNELGQQNSHETYDHAVGLNCSNLERLVELLQNHLSQAEMELASAQARKKDAEKKCKQAEDDVAMTQQKLEKIEQSIAETNDDNSRLNEKHNELTEQTNSLQARLTSAQENVKISQNQHEEMNKVIKNSEVLVMSLDEQIINANNAVEKNNFDVDAMAKRSEELKAHIGIFETKFAEAQANVKILEGKRNEMDGVVEKMVAKKKSLDEQISNANNAVENINLDVDARRDRKS